MSLTGYWLIVQGGKSEMDAVMADDYFTRDQSVGQASKVFFL